MTPGQVLRWIEEMVLLLPWCEETGQKNPTKRQVLMSLLFLNVWATNVMYMLSQQPALSQWLSSV